MKVENEKERTKVNREPRYSSDLFSQRSNQRSKSEKSRAIYIDIELVKK